MKKILRNRYPILALVLVVAFVFGRCEQGKHAHANEEMYTCPMHPAVLKDKPGSCPVCGMDLVRRDKLAAGPVDSMTAAMARHNNDMREDAVKLITGELAAKEISINAQGVVTYDTRFVYTVPSRVAGRLENVAAKFEYQSVRKGERLAEIYSPELVAAQKDVLYLTENDPNGELLEPAKKKLMILGMTAGQVQRLVETKVVKYNTPIFSPYSGYVISTASVVPVINAQSTNGGTGNGMGSMGSSSEQKQSAAISIDNDQDDVIRAGQYVQADQPLVKIVSKDALRVELNLPSEFASLISKGAKVDLNFGNGHAHKATVDFIEPYFSGGQEFLKVRVYTSNMQNMHIGHLVDAKISTTTRESLWVPRSSVVNLGVDQVIFLQHNGRFEPNKVTAGIVNDEMVQIKSGLDVNDSIALNASYLVDSESFIKLKQASQ